MHDRIIRTERSPARARVVIEVYKPAPLLIAPDINPHTHIRTYTQRYTHYVLVLSCCKLASYLYFHGNKYVCNSLIRYFVDFHLFFIPLSNHILFNL